ncbi:MAG: hypothetical protein IRY92_00445, partial [Dactylosporangium sp.]|nr:hypothetical protein [Dactylosporangium sp.]
VQQRSAELANVQFAVNDTIKIFSDQQSDYEAKVKAVEDAIEILQERQKRGIPLTAEESALLAHQDEILGRLKGGVEDATVAKGIAAGVSAELMKAQDELNAAIRDYGRDAPQALEAQQRYNEALDQARELGLDNAVAMSGNQQALADLTTVIEQRLVPQIYNLARALAPNSIPRDVQIEVQLADQIARQQLEALKQDIASGAVLPVSITTGTVGPGGGPQNRFAAGGTAREDMVALVGEQGPELVILPRGAHVIPTDQTRRLLRFAGAFADGGTIGGGAPGSTTLTLPNWDWLFAGLADAAAKWSKEAAEQVRQFLDAVQSGYETLRGAMTFSREFAAFQASGGSLPDAAALSPLVQLSEAVTTAFADSAAAFSAGRAKEWADTVRNFTDVASGGIQALSSMLKLLTELEDAPAFANDEATRERISALKFLTEHLAVSLGDSAAFIATHRPMDFGPLLKAFGEDVGPAIQALTDMLRLISELEDAPAFANDEATREQISQLKFLVEHLALSLGDTAAFVAASRPEQFTEELRSFSEDVAPGITALANLVELLHTLLDPDAPAFRDTPELRQHLTDLKFLVEHITLSLGDTAQFVQANRPAGFGAAMRTLGEDVVPGIRALAELVGLLRDLSDDTMPPAFTAGLFSGRIAALQVLFEDIAFALSDVATRIAQGRPADFAQQMTEQMDAVKSAIEAEREVLGLVNDLAQGTQLYLSPDRMRRRSEALADTVVLIATDLSAAADRLVQESPHILEKLETFSETIAPGVASVTEVVEGMEAIAGMSRISERQSRVFADNMERVAQMVEVGTDKLRRLDENGTLDDFRRIVLDLIGTLRTALAALGGGGTNSGAPQATPGVTVGGSATRVADVMAAYRDTTIRPAEAPVATVPSVTPQSGDARWQYGGAAHGPQTIIVNVGNEELERFVLRGMRRTVRLGVGGNVGV